MSTKPEQDQTSEGLVLGTLGNPTLQIGYNGRPGTGSTWNAVIEGIGIPGTFGGIQVFGLDYSDHLYANLQNTMWRSRYPITREELGRADALAGPGCEQKDRLYPNPDAFDGFGEQGEVTWVNASEDQLTIFYADPNGFFHTEATLGPGESETQICYLDRAFMATDQRSFCRGIQWLRQANQVITFE